MRDDFYVYIIFRLDGTPCYVGKGHGDRWKKHEYAVKQGRHLSNHRLEAIIRRAGGVLPKEKFQEGLTEEDAFATERCLISAIGRGKHGPLVNLTDGGEGTVGLELSDERKKAISLVHKGKIISETHKSIMAKASSERVWSQYSREKIGKSNRGKKRDAATIENMRSITKEQMKSPLRKAAVAAANKRRVWTPEMRIAHGLKMAAVWRDNHV